MIAELSVVVISYNSAGYLTGCLGSLINDQGVRLAIFVVDNASSDGSDAVVQERFPSVSLIRNPQNLGYAGAANVGIRASETDVVVLLNPDVVIDQLALRCLAEALRNDPKAAIAGCKLLFPDGKTIQHAGGTLSYPLALSDHYGYAEEDKGQWDTLREVEYVTGAAFAVKKPVLDKIGYFDEGFYPAYYEEADLCFRARRAGLRVLYVPKVAVHHTSVTTGGNLFLHYHLNHRNRLRFVLKHYADDQLLLDFLPAELKRLRQIGLSEELEALQQAYADIAGALEGRADFAMNPGATAPLPSNQRRLEMMQILAGDIVLARASRDLEARRRPSRLAELDSKSQIVESPFVSDAPAVGPLIVRFRELWNWMSTKWYVSPLIEQQSLFNALTVESLQTLDDTTQRTELGTRDIDLTIQALHLALRELSGRLKEIGGGPVTRPGQPDTGGCDVVPVGDLACLMDHLQRLEDRLAKLEQLCRESGWGKGSTEI